jgi:hypothetical protein
MHPTKVATKGFPLSKKSKQRENAELSKKEAK